MTQTENTKPKSALFRWLSRYPSWLVNLGILAAVLLMFWGAAESFFRFRLWNTTRKNKQDGVLFKFDREVGWIPYPGFHWEGNKKDAKGNKYWASVEYDKQGFRRYGNLTSGRPRIFIVGDSFTQALDVSLGDTYDDRIADYLDAEVFTYGVGGYGTLQESIILNRYINQIKPDLVILQMCGNDLVNNSLELERKSTVNFANMARPYLMPDGTIKLTVARHLPGLRMWAFKHSRSLYDLFVKWDVFMRIYGPLSIDHVIYKRGGKNMPEYDRAKKTTRELLLRIKKSCGTTPLVSFCVEEDEPAYSVYLNMNKELGIDFVQEVPSSITKMEALGVSCKISDKAHWNTMGHRVAGQQLANYLHERYPNLFPTITEKLKPSRSVPPKKVVLKKPVSD